MAVFASGPKPRRRFHIPSGRTVSSSSNISAKIPSNASAPPIAKQIGTSAFLGKANASPAIANPNARSKNWAALRGREEPMSRGRTMAMGTRAAR